MFPRSFAGVFLAVAVSATAAPSSPSPEASAYTASSVYREGNLACRFVPVPRARYHDAARPHSLAPSSSARSPASPAAKTVYERHCWQVAD